MNHNQLPSDDELLDMTLKEWLALFPRSLPVLSMFAASALTENAVQPEETLRGFCRKVGGDRQTLLSRLKRWLYALDSSRVHREEKPSGDHKDRPTELPVKGSDQNGSRNSHPSSSTTRDSSHRPDHPATRFVVCGWFGYFDDRSDGDDLAYEVLETLIGELRRRHLLDDVDVRVHNCPSRQDEGQAIVAYPGPKRYEDVVPALVPPLLRQHIHVDSDLK